MMAMIRRRGAVMLRGLAILLVAAAGSSGCGMLDVDDPTAVEDSDLNDASGARLLRGNAVRELAIATVFGALYGGLLADEFRCCSDPALPEDRLNRRADTQYDDATVSGVGNTYTRWQQLRVA